VRVCVDLLQVDRVRTPWLVVGLHRQMVGPTTDPVNVENLVRLQGDLEGLFLQHEVDLVLQGGPCTVASCCVHCGEAGVCSLSIYSITLTMEAVGFWLLMLRVHLAHMLELVYPRVARMFLFAVNTCMVLHSQQCL
jgi:hypothetical protein